MHLEAENGRYRLRLVLPRCMPTTYRWQTIDYPESLASRGAKQAPRGGCTRRVRRSPGGSVACSAAFGLSGPRHGILRVSDVCASPVATADSVAPADFGRHPKAPPGREKGRDDGPRPHSPGWPCPWRYSRPLQRIISPRATVNGASWTAKAGWPFLGHLARLQAGAVREVFPQAGTLGLREDLAVFFTAPVARRRQPGGSLCAAKPCPASMRSESLVSDRLMVR